MPTRTGVGRANWRAVLGSLRQVCRPSLSRRNGGPRRSGFPQVDYREAVLDVIPSLRSSIFERFYNTAAGQSGVRLKRYQSRWPCTQSLMLRRRVRCTFNELQDHTARCDPNAKLRITVLTRLWATVGQGT